MTDSQEEKKKKEYTVFGKTFSVPQWVVSKLLPALLLALIVFIVFAVFYVYRFRPDIYDSLKGLGYLGVFIISISCNAVIILPAGKIVILSALSVVLPPVSIGAVTIPAPFMVAIIGGIGAGLGESTGYLAGLSGRAMADDGSKQHGLFEKVERWINRWGMLIIFLLSGLPFPFDIVGIVSGAVRFPYIKFLTAATLGRMICYAVVCWAVVLGWDSVIKIFS